MVIFLLIIIISHGIVFCGLLNDIRNFISFITDWLVTIKPNNSNKTKSIFVSGSFNQREYLKEKMMQLEEMGFNVTSLWPNRSVNSDNPDNYRIAAEKAFDEINQADTLLVFMNDYDINYGYRGTFTEIGYGIGAGKRIILICDGRYTDETKFSHYCMSNIFFWHPTIEHVSTYENAVELLKRDVTNFSSN
jgi:nucleoside 2-deoxyribosyltransferase